MERKTIHICMNDMPKCELKVYEKRNKFLCSNKHVPLGVQIRSILTTEVTCHFQCCAALAALTLAFARLNIW